MRIIQKLSLRRLLIAVTFIILAGILIVHFELLAKANLRSADPDALLSSLERNIIVSSQHRRGKARKISEGELHKPSITASTAPQNRVWPLQRRSLCPQDEIMASSRVTKLGRYPHAKRFLSIGIASVARPSGADYLLQTTQSLIDSTNNMEKKDIYIVIFLADIHKQPKSTAKAKLLRKFGKYIDQGLLIVVEAFPEFYPPLNNIKEKYNDSEERRIWRSKENVDAMFAMCYCKNLSRYYLHLEDDVISSPSFFPKLQDFIKSQSEKPWIVLDLTVEGSKAKVFHSKDVENVASYFYLMYDEMPIDWLMDYWRKIKDEDKSSLLLPPASLFQHIGDQSSLEEKGLSGRDQKEVYFDRYDQKYRGRNPPATVTSSMSSVEGKPQDAYDKGSGYFWAEKAQENDFILIVFNTPTAIQKIFIDTGCHQEKDAVLENGIVQVSFASAQVNINRKANGCGKFQTFGSFAQGQLKLFVNKSRKAICVRILVTENQSEWIYFREIDVWSVRKSRKLTKSSTLEPKQ